MKSEYPLLLISLLLLINPQAVAAEPYYLAWARSAGGQGREFGGNIITAPDGGVIVTGAYTDVAVIGQGETNETTLAKTIGFDSHGAFIARYLPNGSLAWAHRVAVFISDETPRLALLPDGGIICAGHTTRDMTTGADVPDQDYPSFTRGIKMLVARYELDGQRSWIRQVGTSDNFNKAYAVAAVDDGNFVVAGYYTGASTFGAGETQQTTLPDSGAFIAKYRPDGSLVLAKRDGNENGYIVRDMVTCPNGDIITMGHFSGAALFGDFAGTHSTLYSTGSSDIFVSRYDNSGHLIWARSAGSPDSDWPFGIAAMPDGGVVVTGHFQETATFGRGEVNQTNLTAVGWLDGFVARYNADGDLAWARRMGSQSSDSIMGAAVLADGDIVVCGNHNEALVLGKGEANETVLNQPGNIFIRYHDDGSLAWARRTAGFGFDITTLPNNEISVTGIFDGQADFNVTGTTPAILTPAGDGDVFVARYQLSPSTPTVTPTPTPEPQAGMTWIQATGLPSFPARLKHTSVAFNGKLWVIGGNDGVNDRGDVWSSPDGITWNQVTDGAPFLGRDGHSSVVYNNKIWVIGGYDEIHRIPKNDVWSSTDGIQWAKETGAAAFPPRYAHTSVIFDNKIWIIGGRGEENAFLNDIWWSSDGATWVQATGAAAFPPRSMHASAVFDNKIWVIGGHDRNEYKNDLWSSSDGMLWTLESPSSVFTARAGHSCVVFDNKLLIIGGRDSNKWYNDLWSSTDGISWVKKTDAAIFSPRVNHTCVAFNGNIWVTGGYGKTGIKNDVWSSHDGTSWTCLAGDSPFPPRFMHASAVFNGKIWVINGFFGGGMDQMNIWCSSDGKIWSQATDAIGSFYGRYGHSSVVFDDKLWLIGGIDKQSYVKNDVWSSADGTTWTQATDVAAFPRRYGHTSLFFNNKMWVIGGRFGSTYFNDVWFSSDGITWTQATSSAGFSPRAGHTSLMYKNKIWVIGGNNSSGPMNDVWSSSDGGTWTRAASAAAFPVRSGHSSVDFDNKMWVIGGWDGHYSKNDIWCSSDGLTWSQVIGEASFAPRRSHSSVVFNNSMWVMGGDVGTQSTNIAKNDVWHSPLLSTPTPTPTPTPDPVIVLAPNGGEIYSGGSFMPIQWKTDLVAAGSAVRLELHDATGWVANLGYDWQPEGHQERQIFLPLVPEGAGYRIRAISAWNENLKDESDGPFTITGGPMRLRLPNGGEVWPAGSQQPVWWEANPLYAGTAVGFELWRGPNKVVDLGVDWSPEGKNVIWISVPATEPGEDYALRAVSLWDGRYFDVSDGPLIIRNEEWVPPQKAASSIWVMYE